MRSNSDAEIGRIREVYQGVQRRLYELFMGQQIHVGGARSSVELAEAAGVGAGQRGVELCCGSGAAMRLLVRMFDVATMTGVELAPAQVERGRAEAASTGVADRVTLHVGDATHTDLSNASADFVWGEDAWCYVPDKAALLAEAFRVVRAGGTVAFTDWVEGPAGLSDDEAAHVMQTMTFPNLQTIDGYRAALAEAGFDLVVAEDTGRFGPSFALYANMLDSQLTFDALELLDFSDELLGLVIDESRGLSRLGLEHKLVQGRFVARKP